MPHLKSVARDWAGRPRRRLLYFSTEHGVVGLIFSSPRVRSLSGRVNRDVNKAVNHLISRVVKHDIPTNREETVESSSL